MTRDNYLDKLKSRYSHYYNINPAQLLDSVSDLELCASYSLKITKNSILLRSIPFYSIKESEHCFVRIIDKRVSIENLMNFTEEIKLAGDEIINPNENHKKTILTCVVISRKGIEDSVIDYVEKFKFQKSYCLYLHGWSEMRIVLIDLMDNTMYHNIKKRKQKEQIETFYKIG